MRLVIVESPFAGRAPRWTRWFPPLARLLAALQRWRNVLYARAAVRDCVLRGEAPIASHLLFTQPGILRDAIPAERAAGIEAGLAWGRVACLTAAYVDRGVSRGMEIGMERARAEGRAVVTRTLPGWGASRAREARVLERLRAAAIALAVVTAIAISAVAVWRWP